MTNGDEGHPKNDAYTVMEDGISVNDSNVPANALLLILVTLVGILALIKDEH